LPRQNGNGGADGLKGSLNVLPLGGEFLFFGGNPGKSGIKLSLLRGQGFGDSDIDWCHEHFSFLSPPDYVRLLDSTEESRESKGRYAMMGFKGPRFASELGKHGYAASVPWHPGYSGH
jgi:hypothetical protein